jgi:hypothetical protein
MSSPLRCYFRRALGLDGFGGFENEIVDLAFDLRAPGLGLLFLLGEKFAPVRRLRFDLLVSIVVIAYLHPPGPDNNDIAIPVAQKLKELVEPIGGRRVFEGFGVFKLGNCHGFFFFLFFVFTVVSRISTSWLLL